MPSFVELTEQQKQQIHQALAANLPHGIDADFDEDGVTQKGANYYLPISPKQYPEEMYAFMEGLAKAEIALRDTGLNVRLSPDVRQRMLVVARVKGDQEIAFLTTDGTEYGDLTRLLNVPQEDLMPMDLDGYAYDSKHDLEEVISEAQEEHPKADFSRVTS